jgi:predicted aspartyl protease
MPVHTSISIGVNPKTGLALEPGILQVQGPVLQCAVMLDTRRAQALVQAGGSIPPPKPGRLLIDTGASMTSIERTVLQELGIPSIGDCQVKTPSGGETQQVYPCGLVFPGTKLPTIGNIFVLGANLLDQGIIGLLGRDLLRSCVFIFNGQGGEFTIAL